MVKNKAHTYKMLAWKDGPDETFRGKHVYIQRVVFFGGFKHILSDTLCVSSEEHNLMRLLEWRLEHIGLTSDLYLS